MKKKPLYIPNPIYMTNMETGKTTSMLESEILSLNKRKNKNFIFINDVRDKINFYLIILTIWLIILTVLFFYKLNP